MYLAAVALVLAFLYALTLAPLWGGASSAASTVSAPTVDAVSPETQRHTDDGGGGGGGWGAGAPGTRFTCFTSTTVHTLTAEEWGGGAPEDMQASPDAEYSDAEYPEVTAFIY